MKNTRGHKDWSTYRSGHGNDSTSIRRKVQVVNSSWMTIHNTRQFELFIFIRSISWNETFSRLFSQIPEDSFPAEVALPPVCEESLSDEGEQCTSDHFFFHWPSIDNTIAVSGEGCLLNRGNFFHYGGRGYIPDEANWQNVEYFLVVLTLKRVI